MGSSSTLQSWYLCNFHLSRLNFIFINCQQLLTAVHSEWQLLTADESCQKIFSNEIFIYPLNLIPVPNFSSLGQFYFHQLSTAFESCWQLMTAVTIFVSMGSSSSPKADTCVKFQLSGLILIFISCQQLLTADESCHNFFYWDLHLLPKADTCAKFQFSRLLWGLARECDPTGTDRQTDKRTHARWR